MARALVPPRSREYKILAPALLLFSALLGFADAQFAAMSVDLGSHFFKVSLVKPGVPMQIALNRESGRRTPTIVAMKDDELFFSTEAENQRRRSPSSSYVYLIDLLGKKVDNPVVHEYHKRFPFAQLVGSLNRGTVVFKTTDGKEGYNPEQLIGMILSEARSIAESFAGQTVVDAVISVPGFFNQAERRAMLTAAKIAGLNVLNLINDHTAAGLNYGMFRRNEFTEKPTTVLIYDLGASKATVSIFEYVMVGNNKTKEKYPQMNVLGVGFDRFLGGLEFSMRLRNLLADKFAAQHRSKTPIGEDHRSMTKLLYEAERVKVVLSGINDTVAKVETLHEGVDFRAPVTRAEFENACDDLYDRIGAPVEQALKMANLSQEQLDHVILMGAASRMPKFQQVLSKLVNNKPLGRYLNADEAIAMGAIYHAAPQIKGFKVKKFVVKEINLYPIEVHFNGYRMANDSEMTRLRRTLYYMKNGYPQKKMITFSKHTHDFEFILNYGDLTHLNEQQLASFGSRNITRVDLLKVQEAFNNHSEEGTVFKGIRTHFEMDDSGVVHVREAESVFHKPPPPAAEPSTLSKIGHTISNFFTGSDDGKHNASAGESSDPNSDVNATSTEHDAEHGAAVNDSRQRNSSAAVEQQQQQQKQQQQQQQVAKPVVIKVPLQLQLGAMDVPFVSAEWVNHSMERLKAFNDVKQRRELKEKAINELESFLFETSDRIDQEQFAVLLKEDEMQALRAKLNSIREWMDEQDANTTAEQYEKMLNASFDATRTLANRYVHREQWPEAVGGVRDVLNKAKAFQEKAGALLQENVFTEVEMRRLGETINETQLLLLDMETTHNATALDEDPLVTVGEVYTLGARLERDIQYLMNKMLINQQNMANSKLFNDTLPPTSNNNTDNVADTNRTQFNATLDGVDEKAADFEERNDTHVEL